MRSQRDGQPGAGSDPGDLFGVVKRAPDLPVVRQDIPISSTVRWRTASEVAPGARVQWAKVPPGRAPIRRISDPSGAMASTSVPNCAAACPRTSSRATPRHPLWEFGYLSIGCLPCTRPVAAGEDPRTGRWDGLDKTECGIHGNPWGESGSQNGGKRQTRNAKPAPEERRLRGG